MKPPQTTCMSFSPDQTLQELEGDEGGELNFDSALAQTCRQLRLKPLQDFTTEDLRLMIGQQAGLPFLVPLAIERLGVNPFARGDDHPGDLLLSVLRVRPVFWREHPQLLWQFQEILLALIPTLEALRAEIARFVSQEERFKSSDA